MPRHSHYIPHGVIPAVLLPDASGTVHLVGDGDERGDVVGGKVAQSGTHLVENILRGVQGTAGRHHVEDGDRSLERVDGAERAVDPVSISGVAGQRGEIAVRLGNLFRRLDQKLFEQFVHHPLR